MRFLDGFAVALLVLVLQGRIDFAEGRQRRRAVVVEEWAGVGCAL